MLRIDKLKKKYRNKKIFNETSLDIKKGLYLLQGENGSGKTTLFNILYKLDTKYDGEIYIDDRNINDIDSSVYRSSYISYVNQEFNLFANLTIKGNIALLLSNVNETKFVELVNGLKLDKILNNDKKLKYFSGGEIQKVKILIGLLTNNPIVLLDEPDNNLDYQSIEFLLRYLIRENKILIISSHLNNEYIKDEFFNNIIIENETIKIEENIETVDEVIKPNKKKMYINDNVLKKLVNKFKFQRRLILFISLILMSSFFLLFSQIIVSIDFYGEVEEYNMKDNVVEIFPPILSLKFQQFGDESYLEKTPYLFNKQEYNYLKSRDDIVNIIPIGSVFTSINSISYEVPNALDLSKLDYNKYSMEQYSSNDVVNVFQGSCIEPKVVSLNGYINYCTPDVDIVYGEYPKDESDEIVVDPYIAMYYAQEKNINNLEKMIGQTISVKLNFYDAHTDKEIEQTKEFVVSGIATPVEGTSYFITGYNSNSSENPQNHPWLGEDYVSGEMTPKEYLYDTISSLYEYKGIDMVSIDQFPNPKDNAYPGFYIELNSSKDVENLVNDIQEYNPYIDIKSNYSREHTNNFLYMKNYINQRIILLMISIILIILIISLLTKYYSKSISKDITKLRYFGFDDNEIQKYLKANNKSLLNILIIEIILFVIVSGIMIILWYPLIYLLFDIIFILLYLILIKLNLR